MTRNHIIWGGLGALAVYGLWYAYSVPGAIALFTAIGGAFVLWKFIGSRGAWVALAVTGITMAGLLGWQSVTSARCPAAGERIIIKDGKPPVSCDELRASAAAMATFFALVGLIGLVTPLYVRGVGRDGTKVEVDAYGVPIGTDI